MKEHSCSRKIPPRVKYSDTSFLYLLWKDRMAISAIRRAAHRMPEDR